MTGPAGDLLATWGWSAELQLWDVATGQVLFRAPSTRTRVWRPHFSRDGLRLARRRGAAAGPTALIIDGTERRRPRPKNAEKQARHYSGKKKTHTDKNVVVTSAADDRVLFLSGTSPGATNDNRRR